jgi:general secretion pathway protein L
MTATLVLALPAVPDARDATTCWWSVVDGAIVARGADDAWRDLLAGDGSPVSVIALAPAAATRIGFARIADMPPRQAAAIARLQALEPALGDPATLHCVARAPAPPGDHVITAVVANATMLEWLDWLDAMGVDAVSVIPAALLLPLGDDWRAARIAGEPVIGRSGIVFPNEPALVSALVGQEEVAEVAPEIIDAALLAALAAPPLDLRVGAFARRRRWFVDRARVRELAILLAFVPLIALMIALVTLWQLDASADRLDADAVARASAALGKPVTIATAEAELDVRASQIAGAGGQLATPLAALYQQMQGETTISATALGWRSDGTLAATLAAPRIDEINRLLLGLQRDGYTVTAVPRQGSDGRSIADMTIRAQP